MTYEGIRYVAPNDDGRRGYIEAWNVGNNKKLWELESLLMLSNLEGECSVGVHQGIKHPRWQAYSYIGKWTNLSGRSKHESNHAN